MAKHKIRPIRIEGNVAYVTLTKGYVAVIDAADVHLVDKWNWTVKVTETNVYAKRNNCASRPHRVAYMHRCIMGEPEGLEVDHIDGDGLNNQRHNLRAATRTQNSTNVKLRASNTSGYKGACWDKKRERWVAHIRVNGVQTYLGYFASAEAAHRAYAAASAKPHGEFGRVA
jgi:hypothetical protein